MQNLCKVIIADKEFRTLRRKRFTRRQRRNLTGGIFGERTSRSTSTLNKLHRSGSTTSSSDNDNINERKKRSVNFIKNQKFKSSIF